MERREKTKEKGREKKEREEEDAYKKEEEWREGQSREGKWGTEEGGGWRRKLSIRRREEDFILWSIWTSEHLGLVWFEANSPL